MIIIKDYDYSKRKKGFRKTQGRVSGYPKGSTSGHR